LSADVYWVDANVLVRFLTDDPPEMAERAMRLLERVQRGGIRVKIHAVVVAETVWVLDSFYGYSRDRIADTIVPLLEDHGLRVEEPKIVIGALHRMAQSNVDFADALLAETALTRAEGVVSFDKDFRKLGVDLHEPP
jgi:predicted nucleic-acid-binding protein